jgi:hypothetical protein
MSSSAGQHSFIYAPRVPNLVVSLDVELLRRVSERLGTFERKSMSGRIYGEPEFRNMRWNNPRSLM